ncbi:SDR family NAD(P)-dependent oxidoreductase [Deinococcus sp. HMF7620]|uniref:SDR family NAD(P)-dependent oxidoreductase n=1 Tax=Deinococcus arboris TaxID=2682977 RepID=A0A7C9LSX0_9DEIO|nr:SDR family oxidoreductase [Deinococcus arboris]MVN88541.1 SDR family NAD(P)-dependent oxidoreductase [Deinococcus arboris]
MDPDLTPLDWQAAQRVLKAVLRNPALADDQPEFRTLVAGVNRLGRKHARQAQTAQRPAPDPQTQRRCYMCRQPFGLADAGNPACCAACGQLNRHKRRARADLTGRVALLTGGRVNIGYATALRLLRSGAQVTVTTRFPMDAAQRYASEPDAHEWRSRLTLYGLDLRDIRAVQAFTDELGRTLPHLDILINNAAQTIARPPTYYAPLLGGERQALPGTALDLKVAQSAPAALLNGEEPSPFFPLEQLDRHGHALDRRPHNSWTARLDDVEARELLEVQLVNTTAPYLLCSGLLPLLRRSPFQRRFIVNVSAVEGQFARAAKNDRHPHTNMAKAALNMLTRTSGPRLARESIYMTSVDPGWVSQQEPHPQQERMAAQGFRLPLDLDDAAARLCDPIFTGLNEPGRPLAGVFLKDYRVQPW